MQGLFGKTDILIPAPGIDMPKWSVIACDQHTSEPEYWDGLDTYIGGAPSTLRMIMPEAYLGRDLGYENINAAMRSYLDGNVFREIKNSMIYVERRLSNGKTRKGLVGALNLKENVLTTEGVVQERLPARIAIRKAAPLEIPHAMIFTCEDVFSTVQKGEMLYDFELNNGGGHIKGWLAEADTGRITKLAIGDGNHSIAAAKRCGDETALAELVDINDEAIDFEPIHRVIFGTKHAEPVYMDTVAEAEAFCRDYTAKHGGTVDYIHDDSTALQLGSGENSLAVILPPFDKQRLFDDIEKYGPYPKKSFSIGHSNDKRYYLECRKIND